MKREHQEELNFLKEQNEELKRRSDIYQQEVRDEVEKLWRAKVIEKESSITLLQEQIDSDSRKYSQELAAKDFELRDTSSQLNDLKSKIITLQAENDDFSSKLAVGKLNQNSIIEKQKVRIEKLEADLNLKETIQKERLRDLTQQTEKLLHENHSKDLELASIKERMQYEIKTVAERSKLDCERQENNYKFQIRKLDDKILDQEREIDRLRLKEDTNTNKIITLERTLALHTDKKDAEWKSRIETHEREILDLKQTLQEKSNKIYLLKEKFSSTELNFEAKMNECKKLRFEMKDIEERMRELEDQNHLLKTKGNNPCQGDNTEVKLLKNKNIQLEMELQILKKNLKMNQNTKIEKVN